MHSNQPPRPALLPKGCALKSSFAHLVIPALLATLLGVTLGLAAPTPARRAHTPSTPPSTTASPPITPPRTHPLLPPQASITGLYPELTLLQKLPQIAPSGFAPLYSPADWQAYRALFGPEADALTQKRASGQLEFASKLLDTAAANHTSTTQPGLHKLLLTRAGAISYRTTGGFPIADRAVQNLLQTLDQNSPAHVAALWTLTNQISRMSVTPKPQRIRYSALAARANLQLTLLLLESDQLESAQGVIKLVGYHEGWLKADPTTRREIAQVRAEVNRTVTLLEYLDKQYPLAVQGDDKACMSLYLWARYVKNYPTLQSEIITRKPHSPAADLHQTLAAADRDPLACYTAAESLQTLAATQTEGLIKQRILHASLKLYRTFLQSPETENARVKRTLARMAIEAILADGARGPVTLHPLDTLLTAATQPTTQTTASPSTQTASQPSSRPLH